VLLVSQLGQVIRIEAGSVRRTGRSTEGVRLMDVGDEDRVSGVASVVEAEGGTLEAEGVVPLEHPSVE
jgi:DNA gyrase subunit A